MKKAIFVVAGGTGGHINAALSMGDFFSKNYQIIYISGQRHLDYKLFKDKKCIHLGMQALRVNNPLKLITNTLKNLWATLNLIFLFIVKKPAFVVGAGGYVCGPTFMVAKIFFKPTFIIEQNAISGLTNKILAKFSSLVFTHFEKTKGFEKIPLEKIKCFGNPIRSSIQYTANKVAKPLHLLVFGGSLGATQINEVVKEFILQEKELKVHIVHQVGKDQLDKSVQSTENIKYEAYEYLDNIQENYEWANIIIARAGASTVSELRVVKRPSILIPFPAAVDNHQFYNAIELKEENLSYIAVLDHAKDIKSLAKDVQQEIRKINSENLFYSIDKNSDNAVEKIGEEILTYVRN